MNEGEFPDGASHVSALPHRYPFVLVDRVLELISRERVRGYKMVSHNEPWCQGHFPGRPVFPGVLIVEAIAQLSGMLIHADGAVGGAGSPTALLGIDRTKFRRPVVPGDRLELEAIVLQRHARAWKFRGEAHVDGALAAETELLISAS